MFASCEATPTSTAYFFHVKLEVTGMAASDGGDSGDAVYFHPSIIRGHHIYKDIWSPRTGEILEAARECGNRQSHDRHAVSLLKADVIVGHVPRQLSRVYFFFLSHGGKITCEVTGRRKDLGLRLL